MVPLDIKDRKLLYFLSLDARMSDTQLSRKIGLSKNAVKYRKERLEKKGIIQKYAAVVNLGSIGFTTVTFLLRFNEDIYEHPEIISFFRDHPLADWVVTLSGQWDLFVEFTCKSFGHLDRLTHEIISHFSQRLNSYQCYFSNDTLRVEHLIADFYADLKLEPPQPEARTAEKFELDSIDRRILQLLNQDSSLPYLEMARRLNLSLDVVRYRMNIFFQKMMVVKTFAEISLPKLGYQEYLYTIKLRNSSPQNINAMKKKIQLHQNVTYAFFDVHSSHLFFVCAFRTPEGIDHLCRSLRREYNEVIESQDFFLIKEQVLFNLFPPGLLSAEGSQFGKI